MADLQNGHTAERVCAMAYEQEDGNPVIMSPLDKPFDGFDFRRDLRAMSSPDGLNSFETRVEVKWDSYASKRVEKHGDITACNIYFEISSNGKQSGILQTLADEWAHIIADKIYIFEPRELRAMFFKDMQSPSIERIGIMMKGGDNQKSFGWVVSFSKIKPKIKRILKVPYPIYIKPDGIK